MVCPRFQGFAEAELDCTSPHSERAGTRTRAARTHCAGTADAPAGKAMRVGKKETVENHLHYFMSPGPGKQRTS